MESHREIFYSKMPKQEHDRFALLAADIGSPRVVQAIDQALEQIRREWLEILDLRNIAVRRHGSMSPAPTMPDIAPKPASDLPPQVQKISQPDVSVSELLRIYREDKRSTYQTLRFKTRQHYDSMFKRLLEDCGPTNLADLNAIEITRLHEGWAADGKIAMGHAMIATLRIIVNFGATTLENDECVRLSVILRNMRFASARSRTEHLTREQVLRFIEVAHEMNLDSVALAQAIQFGTPLGQKDVIGEWVPQSEEGDESDITDGDMKWLRGIRWSEIDKEWVLRHPASRDGETIEVRLAEAPLVMVEFNRRGKRRATGAVIVDYETGLPYRAWEFRRLWRMVADAAGIPKGVKNMDTRVSHLRSTNPAYKKQYRIEQRANRLSENEE
jgi:hypothetical protein